MTSENKLGISQKEYLKRYLSNTKDDKKKKKKHKKLVSSSTVIKRSKIIDDDVDLKTMRALDDDEVELYQLDEDAPQIAGVIDERPVEVQAMEYYNNTKRWKVFGTDENGELTIKDNFEKYNPVLVKDEPIASTALDSVDKMVGKKSKHLEEHDSDLEPPRKLKNRDDSGSDLSPPRNSLAKSKFSKVKSNYDSELSPPRSKKSSDIKRKDSDSDLSPRRHSTKHSKTRSRRSDSDLSPPRKSNKNSSGSDLSPPRRSDKSSKIRASHSKDSDFSPPRRDKYSFSSKSNYKSEKSMYKYSDAYGNSEERKDRKDDSRYNRFSDDYRNRRKYDNSECQRQDMTNERDVRNKDSPKPYKKDLYKPETSSKHKDSKMEKTLDGKQAGLQDARQLKQELTDFKNREDKIFSKMGSDLSGKGAAPVMRDRKTGLKRDLEREKREALEIAEKSAKENEKYTKWGKGLKQVEEQAERFASAVHEMSKPLARYADDNDLDKFLKAQEREGDPMLDYIRSKQREAIPLTEKKPVYSGTFLPNRFGIRPGYRWDGVDRSSGYEKQWFTTQNNRRARDEEAYKWSISDM